MYSLGHIEKKAIHSKQTDLEILISLQRITTLCIHRYIIYLKPNCFLVFVPKLGPKCENNQLQ